MQTPPDTSPVHFTPHNILVTGGAGFIASHVIIRLVKAYPQYNLVNLDRISYCSCHANVSSVIGDATNYKFVKGDIRSSDLVSYVLRTEQIDTILHFAAQTHVDNSFGNSFQFTQHNIMGTHVLLEAAKNAAVRRFIHVSTDEVYGEGCDASGEMLEEDALEPTNPYAATKAGAEFLVKAYQRSFKLPAIITRGNNVYGPHQFPEKLIPKFTNQLLRGRAVTLHGDGSNTRNFLHVDDVAAAFDILLHKGDVGQIYNIGGSHELSNRAVAQDIIRVLGLADREDALISYVPDRHFNDLRYTIDSSKLRELGWREKITWAEGLRQTVEWYKRHTDRFANIEQALVAHPRFGEGSC